MNTCSGREFHSLIERGKKAFNIRSFYFLHCMGNAQVVWGGPQMYGTPRSDDGRSTFLIPGGISY